MTRFGKTIARSIPAAFLALVVSAFANAASVPTGGAVAVGSATITTPAPNQMVVNQSSNTALINWNSFSISSNASVTFNQPNAASLTVNRVIGPYASIIDGELLANGDIWLINANGILFGEGSEINVGALLATTSDISDDDFRAGKYNFTKASANSAASVINQGTIEAANGGYVVLSGQTVANGGLIEATLGTVVLGGAPAFTIDMTGDKLLSYQIVAPQSGQNNSTAAFVSNAGTIVANGGQVLLTARAAQNVEDNVINNTGIIEATSVSSQNGEIILDAGSNGTVNDSGTLNASGTGAGQTGGTVAITGGTVNVNNGATINASGAAGGGTVEIGGGLHGQGAIADAQTTNVGNATISANAIATGNGGSVTIWSNGTTNFSGSISAQGGAQGGNGGTVETSGGQLNVGLSATVNTEAPKGSTGDWLLDPTDITIQTGGADGVGCGNADCTIAPATITTALNTTDVMLDATSDITVSSEISYSSTNSLTLVSGGTINIDADILNSKSGSLIFNAGGTITIDTSAITTRGTQTFNGPVSLGVDTNLTGSLVDFESTVNDTAAGAQSLTVTGDAEFDGKVGGGEALASLTVSGTTLLTNGITVGTTGDQTYTGAVTLGSDAAITTYTFDSTGGTVDFGATLNGTVAGEEELAVGGNAEFDGNVGGGEALGSLSVSGTTDLNGATVKTTNADNDTGNQTYTGAVTLTGNETLKSTGGLVDFESTVNDATAGAQSLTVTGDAEFDGKVGGGEALASLTVSGTTLLTNGITVGTTGDQTYTGAVTLGSDAAITTYTFDSTGGTVDFGATLNGTVAGEEELAVGGNAEFDGKVGGGETLGSLSVSGTTDLNGATVKTTNADNDTGNQTYTGAVTLTGNETLKSTGGLVDFESTVNDTAAGAQSLTVTGDAEFDGKVGGGEALASLTVSGTTLLTNGITVGTTGDQTYTGAVTLGSDAAITTYTFDSTGGTVDFGATLNGTVAGEEELAVGGNAEFDGNVGGGEALGSLSVSGTTDLNGATVKTTNADNDTGNQTYTGAVTLTSNETLKSTGGLVDFESTVNDTAAGAQSLTVTGDAEFDGKVGGGEALASLTVSGTTLLTNGITVGTTGDQTYTGAVTLGSDAAITTYTFDSTGGTVDFGATLNGTVAGEEELAVGGNAEFDGNVGGGEALGSLSVSGTTDLNGATVKTTNADNDTGNQTYTGAVTLTSNETLKSTGGLVDFESTVNGATAGAQSLTVTGDAEFDGKVGGGEALASLTTNGGSLDLTADVTTTNNQSYTVTGSANTLNVPSGVTLTSNSGNISLTTTSPATDITVEGTISATSGTVTLTSTGNIDASTGIVDAKTLTGSSAGTTTLTDASNDIGTLNGFTNTSGAFSLTDDATLTITGTLNATGETVTLTTTGNGLVLDAALTGATVDLVSTGTIDEDNGAGSITANALTGSSGGAVTLTGTNAIANLGAFATGNNDFTLDDGALSITGNLDAGSGTVDLVSTGMIDEDNGAGSITANELTGSSSGDVTLTGTNAIAALGAFTTDNNGFTLDDGSLSITGNLDAGTGTVDLVSTGTIDEDNGNGSITANELKGSSVGGATLTDANAIGTISGYTDTAGNVDINDNSALSITGLIDVGTNILTLTDSSTIAESGIGTIDAGTLTGSSVGGATLTGANLVTTFGGFSNGTSGTLSFTDAQSLATTGTLSSAGALTLTTTGTGHNLTLGGALTASGQTVTLTSAGTIAQLSGVITAGTLTGSSVGGATLTGANLVTTFGGFSNGTSGTLSFTDAQSLATTGTLSSAGALTLTTTGTGHNLTLGGALTASGQTVTLTSAGTIAQLSGVITAGTLTGSSVGGATLTDANAIGTISGYTDTAGNVDINDNSALSITGLIDVGTNILTLTDSSTIAESGIGAIDAGTLTGSSVGGATLTDANAIGTISGYTDTAGNVDINDNSALSITGLINVGTNILTLTDSSTIAESGSGAIDAGTLTGSSVGGATLTDANAIGTISGYTDTAGNVDINDNSALSITGLINVGTNILTLTDSSTIAESGIGAIDAGTLIASTSSSTDGDITLTNAANQVATVELNTTGTGDATLYDAESLTVSSSFVNGNLTMLTTGNLVFVSSVQSPTGAILAVAGWDGTTTDPSALTAAGAYGNNGGSIVIGGSGASGNVAVGTIGGSTTLAGDNVSLEAINGYAQIGYDGAASGNVAIVANGNVTLTGGAQTGQFAQIGNGGYETSGNESGNISIDAVGSLILNGGTGQEAYSQVGQGGAESNAASSGYSETGTITVDAETVALAAGAGTGSYAQIGEGGYETGKSLDGTAVLSGTITVDATTAVTLTGNGDAAYAQIGSGGDLVNSGAADGSSGVLSGDVVVDVSAPASRNAVTLTAGTGAAAYTQIGNGGNDENAPASGATVSFDVTGDISVSDLALTGSTTGADAYAQVGNGDASNLGTGNIDGTITIWPAEDVTLTYGTATGADVLIGNATEFGTARETLVGYVPMTDQTTSVIATTIQPGSGTKPGTGTNEGQPGSDILAEPLGSQAVRSALAAQTIIPTLLTQIIIVGNTRSPHGVPPADEDYSSWGNEALWR